MTKLSTPEAIEILTGLDEVKACLTTLAGEVHLQREVHRGARTGRSRPIPPG
jgi:hypothetical protein